MKSPIELICVFDIETTGLTAGKHAITEIACCMIDANLNDVGEWSSGIIKLYGDREVQDKALEVSGITRDQIANGKESKEVIAEMIKFIKGFKKTPAKIVLAGHNIDSFDIPHMVDFFEYHKKDLSKIVSDKVTFDTMWWSRFKWTESSNFKLGTCCNNVGITLVDGHRALNDTRANKELVKSYIKSLRGEGSKEVKKEERARAKFEF